MSRRLEKQRQKRKQRRIKRRLCLAVLLVLCVGYVVMCALPEKGKVIKSIRVNGTDVSGMSGEEVARQVQADFEQKYKNQVIQVGAEGQFFQVPMYESLFMDAEGAAEEALRYGHESFPARGWQYLYGALFGYDIVWNPQLSGGEQLDAAMEASGLTKLNTTVQTTYEVTKDSLLFHKGKTGASVDTKGLAAEIRKAVEAADYNTVIESPLITGKVEPVDMQAVYNAVHTKKSDATLDPKHNYKIVKSVRGVDFDINRATAMLDAAAEGADVPVPIVVDMPKITTKKLKKHLFKNVLGTCTTNVSGSSARVSNVSLAAKTINGIILLPGEEFSYNDTLGQRTTDKGYRSAPAYSNGQSVQELGGGICQVSSTLYKATLLSNLKIVEHHNHSYVSAYIGIGMDATVSWGGPDFKFKNNTDYPIKIKASCSKGQLTCKIKGTNLKKRKVKMTAEVIQVNGRGTVYRDDPSMEKGKSVVVSSGHDGYVVQTYRHVYNKKGKKISTKKEARCVYRKQDRVICVGTKEPEPAAGETETGEDSGKG